ILTLDFFGCSPAPELNLLESQVARPQAIPDQRTHPSRPSLIHCSPGAPGPWIALSPPLSLFFSHVTLGDIWFYTCCSSQVYFLFNKRIFYSAPQTNKQPEAT
uniref:Uncharacterized protein n=1 Tax=Macaca fascicularis TaxID=9541 RepID=A0A7N9IH97_MACFA